MQITQPGLKINRKIHSCETWILCLNGPMCFHNILAAPSTLENGMQAVSINTIVSIIFIIRMSFEIIGCERCGRIPGVQI